MPLPSELIALVERLNTELNQVEQATTEGLNLIRPLLSQFPNELKLIESFAFLNSATLAVSIYRGRIRSVTKDISLWETTEAEIQEAGEDLAALLGVILEAKIKLRRIIDELESLEL